MSDFLDRLLCGRETDSHQSRGNRRSSTFSAAVNMNLLIGISRRGALGAKAHRTITLTAAVKGCSTLRAVTQCF